MQSTWKGGDGSRPSCSSQVAQVISYVVWVLQRIPGVSRATRAPHSSTARPQLMGRRKRGCVTAGGLPRPQRLTAKAGALRAGPAATGQGLLPRDLQPAPPLGQRQGRKSRENPNPGNPRIHPTSASSSDRSLRHIIFLQLLDSEETHCQDQKHIWEQVTRPRADPRTAPP